MTKHLLTKKDPFVKLVNAIHRALLAMDMPVGEPGLRETPLRVAKFLMEYRRPFDAYKILGNGFEAPKDHAGMVIQSNIPFRMLCEHHLLPALGKAAIGYVPGKKIVGLSKMARLVEAVGCERPSLQEIICERIANIMSEHIEPKGVIVTIKAEHSCMACRGVATPGVMTTTSSVKGVFRDVPAARQEFFNLIKD